MLLERSLRTIVPIRVIRGSNLARWKNLNATPFQLSDSITAA
jgi:hypothetical protein